MGPPQRGQRVYYHRAIAVYAETDAHLESAGPSALRPVECARRGAFGVAHGCTINNTAPVSLLAPLIFERLKSLVRLSDLSEGSRAAVTSVAAEPMEPMPWVPAKPARERTVALVSSAGLGLRGDEPFRGGDSGYRRIGHQTDPADILMSHVSVNYDRTGFALDLETVLPRRRLDERVAAGELGAVADEHYSFMGATDPKEMEGQARELAQAMLARGVDTALLLPV